MISELSKIVFFTVIAGRKQKDNLLEGLPESGISLVNTMYGKGSVKASYIQDILGLVHEENKIVITFLLPNENTDAAMKMLNEKYDFNKPNTGIAFTVPIDRLAHYRRTNTMESNKGIKVLFIVVNAGFVNEVMEITRTAGMTGATILNARGESILHKTFMGITVDAEKEIILSLVEEDVADKIIAAVEKNAGWKSDAHGVCFTMPVEKVTGLSNIKKQ